MILLIRGHIRKSFETKDLIHFIEKINNIIPDLKIFIHTWNKFANNISWRNIDENNTLVTEEKIYSYFDNLKHLIECIIIDEDSKIEVMGNLNGTINNGPMPIIGWKNYWYGKYKIIDYINNNINDSETIIVNFRFDLLNNSNNFDQDLLVNFIQSNIGIEITRNKFLFEKEMTGIDNIYLGTINTMYILTYIFFHDLDNILDNNNDTIHQEFLVYRINNILFNYT